MSHIKDIALGLVEKVAQGAHLLQDKWWGGALTAFLLLLTFLWILMVEARMRGELARKWGVSPKQVTFGPLHALVGWILLGVGGLHVVGSFFSRLFLDGTYAYGPQGWILGGLWLDSLVPLPYTLALPAAIFVYGYLYCVLLMANAEVLGNIHSPVTAYVYAFLRIPLLPFSLSFSLVANFVISVWRRVEEKKREEKRSDSGDESQEKADAGDKRLGVKEKVVDKAAQYVIEATHSTDLAKKQARRASRELKQKLEEAEPQGREVKPSELPMGVPNVPVDFDTQNMSILMVGHQRLQPVGKPGDRSTDLPVFALFPRFAKAIGDVSLIALIGVVVATGISFVMYSAPREAGFSDAKAIELYQETLKAKGATPLQLIPDPFKEVFPAPGFDFVTVLDPFSPNARYECSFEALERLSEYVGRLPFKDVTWAKAKINECLCREFLVGPGASKVVTSFEEFARALTSLRWDELLKSIEAGEQELRQLEDAVSIIYNQSDDASKDRADMIAGIILRKRYRVRQAQEHFVAALRRGLADPIASATKYCAISQLAELLVSLHRYGEAEKLFSGFAKELRRSASGGSSGAQAISTLVDLQLASLLVRTLQEKDGVEVLKEIVQRAEATAAISGGVLSPLESYARARIDSLPDPSNRRSRQEVFLFGPMPSGILAALLFFLVGIRRSLRTPLAERVRQKREPAPRGPAPKLPEEVSEEVILRALQDQGNFDVKGPVTLWGRPQEDMEQQMAQAAKEALAALDSSADQLSPRETHGEENATAALGPEDEMAVDLKDVGRPIVQFLRTAFHELGEFPGKKEKDLYRHQHLALGYIAQAIEDPRPTAVLLSGAANSGKTFLATAAAMETILERGQSVLFVCADKPRMYKEGKFFDEIRELESWSWSVKGTVGMEGVDEALRYEIPIHLLYANVEVIHRKLLPLEQQHLLSSFLENLGLIVIEDLDAYSPPVLAHLSFVLRRLSELLAAMKARPVTLVTTMPVMSNEEDLVREVCGPMASNIRVVPCTAVKAPEPAEHRIYFLREVDPNASSYPMVSPPHIAAAIIQAAGVRQDQSATGGASDETTWPTCIVHVDGSAPEREDRAVKIYYDAGLRVFLELEELAKARASVFPLGPATAPWFDPMTRHAGIYAQRHLSVGVQDFLGEEGEPSQPDEGPGNVPAAHTSFLLAGPEPVDMWLADKFGLLAGGATRDAENVAEFIMRLRPVWHVPRRNQQMNAYHFLCALQERSAPGHRRAFFEDLIETDLLKELVAKERRAGRLQEDCIPRIDRERSTEVFEHHLWAPRKAGALEELIPDLYAFEPAYLVERVTHQRVAKVEKSRARVVFFPGRVFMSSGIRLSVLAPRYQSGWHRGEWLCEPSLAPLRSSRIRRVLSKPLALDQGLAAQQHAIGRGKPFFHAFSRAWVREEVIGCRFFPLGNCNCESLERYDTQEAEYLTEALYLAFPEEMMAELADDPSSSRRILHGLVLLLRQTLPLVMRVNLDDIEIAFGAGELPQRGEWISINTGAPVRTSADTVSPLPYLVISDRMDGGLGYARILHERLLQGSLFKDWLMACLDLARWARESYDRDELDAFRTTQWFEEEEADSVDARGTLTLLCRLLGEEHESSGVWPTSPPPTAEMSEGEEAERGLQEAFGMGSGEEVIADLLLPEWTSGANCPWAMAFFCALLAGTKEGDERRSVEKVAMGILALRRRGGVQMGMADDSWAPPVGREKLSGWKPKPGDYLVTQIPNLAEGTGTALEKVYGPLARAMGLVKTGGKLTERGCALARSLFRDSRFQQAFRCLKEIVAGKRKLTDADVEPLSTNLLREELPPASLRILADGLSCVTSCKKIGPAWRLSLGRNYQQQHQIDGNLAAVISPSSPLAPDVRKKLELAAAYHAFNRACRTAVAILRVELSNSWRRPVSKLSSQECGKQIYALLRDNATRLLGAPDASRYVPVDVREFASKLMTSPSAEESLSLLIRRLADTCMIRRGNELVPVRPPLSLANNVVTLSRGWTKKYPKDDGRGLLFRLDCLGAFISQTRWHEGLQPLGLSDTVVPACDLSKPLPPDWDEPLTVPTGESEESAPGFGKREKGETKPDSEEP